MKFLHLADLHLGKTLGDFDLKDDQRYILQQILEIAETKQVDAVLIAGDVFDKTVPSEGAVQILDEFICELVERHLQVYMISGNHDSDERLLEAACLRQMMCISLPNIRGNYFIM